MFAAAWEAGERCARHEMAWCGDCLDMAGARRDGAGNVRYKNDCTVATYCELVGCGYDAAVAALEVEGLRPGRGLSREAVVRALSAAGLELVPTSVSYQQMIFASSRGRRFYVSGWKGSGRSARRHSWTIEGGRALRAFLAPPFRFLAWEVR